MNTDETSWTTFPFWDYLQFVNYVHRMDRNSQHFNKQEKVYFKKLQFFFNQERGLKYKWTD